MAPASLECVRLVSRGGKLGRQSVAELGQPGACDTLNSDRRPPSTPAEEEAYATGLAARPTRADRSAPPAGRAVDGDCRRLEGAVSHGAPLVAPPSAGGGGGTAHPLRPLRSQRAQGAAGRPRRRLGTEAGAPFLGRRADPPPVGRAVCPQRGAPGAGDPAVVSGRRAPAGARETTRGGEDPRERSPSSLADGC